MYKIDKDDKHKNFILQKDEKLVWPFSFSRGGGRWGNIGLLIKMIEFQVSLKFISILSKDI